MHVSSFNLNFFRFNYNAYHAYHTSYIMLYMCWIQENNYKPCTRYICMFSSIKEYIIFSIDFGIINTVKK